MFRKTKYLACSKLMVISKSSHENAGVKNKRWELYYGAQAPRKVHLETHARSNLYAWCVRVTCQHALVSYMINTARARISSRTCRHPPTDINFVFLPYRVYPEKSARGKALMHRHIYIYIRCLKIILFAKYCTYARARSNIIPRCIIHIQSM